MLFKITPILLAGLFAAALPAQTSNPVDGVEPGDAEPAPVDAVETKITVEDDAGGNEDGDPGKKKLRGNRTRGTVDVGVEIPSNGEGSSTEGVFIFIEDSGGNIVESKFVTPGDGFSGTLNPGDTLYGADIEEPMDDPSTPDDESIDPANWEGDSGTRDAKVCVSASSN